MMLVCLSSVPVFNVNFNDVVYILLKTGPSYHSISVSGLPSHDVSKPHIIFPTFRSFIFMGMGACSETSDEKRIHLSINSQHVDTSAQLDASLQTLLDRDESLEIR
jgi:hypothetical protein